MSSLPLVKLYEHNNWANQQIIRACAGLGDALLDATPNAATRGSIRETLLHLAGAQESYLRTLTLPLEQRLERKPPPPFAELEASVAASGAGLLALAREEARLEPPARLRTRDGRQVEPWVILVQVINHATEHREQVKNMLSALGITPPDIDGWDFGRAEGALSPAEPPHQS